MHEHRFFGIVKGFLLFQKLDFFLLITLKYYGILGTIQKPPRGLGALRRVFCAETENSNAKVDKEYVGQHKILALTFGS